MTENEAASAADTAAPPSSPASVTLHWTMPNGEVASFRHSAVDTVSPEHLKTFLDQAATWINHTMQRKYHRTLATNETP